MNGELKGIGRRRAAALANGNERYLKRREILIQAAAKVFKENGLAATSIDDIAKEAGLDRASLYYYVGSKEELFHEVVFGVIRSNVDFSIAVKEGNLTPSEKIAVLFEGLLQSYNDNYPHVHVYIQEDLGKFESQEGAEELRSMQREFDAALMAIIQEGVDRGDFREDLNVRLVAYGLIGMVNWSHRWLHPRGKSSAKEVAQTFAAIAIDGLSKSNPS